MARRRDPVQFDLVADDGELGGAGTAAAGSASESVEPGWFGRRVAGPVRDRWRATPRRLRAGIVGVTAVAVVGTAAGVAALDARSDAAHAEHMAEMPGGVADLSEPLEETWRVETDEGVLAVFPDGVVVTRDGTDVLGVDVATGDEVWRHELGALVECGPNTVRGNVLEPVDRLVCVHGQPGRTATVLDASGSVVGQRELGQANGRRGDRIPGEPEIAPAADGAIAVLEPVDEAVPVVDPDDPAGSLARLRADGVWQDPTFRVEDALTGEVRGEATIVLGSAGEDLSGCLVRPPEGSARIDLFPWLQTWFGDVRLDVCDRSAVLSSRGERQEAVRMPSVDGDDLLLGVADGMRFVTPDGGDELPGSVLDPAAADGSDGPRMIRDPEGRLAAVDGSGRRAWTAEPDDVVGVLVRAGGTAVVARAGTVASGIDLGTGEVAWSRDDLVDSTPATSSGALLGNPLTDGSIALLVLPGGPDLDLVAIELDDGRTLWRTELGTDQGNLQAVAGHAVHVVHGGGGFVETVDGVQVVTSDAALVGLAN